jgi:hypothetical protein
MPERSESSKISKTLHVAQREGSGLTPRVWTELGGSLECRREERKGSLMRERRRFSAAFKQQVIGELMSGACSLAQLSVGTMLARD